MTRAESPAATTTAGQEATRAAWLRRTLERAPRPWSPATRKRLGALLAPHGATAPAPNSGNFVLPVDKRDMSRSGGAEGQSGRSGQA